MDGRTFEARVSACVRRVEAERSIVDPFFE